MRCTLRTARRATRFVGLLALGALSLTAGCRAFNYTDEDMEHERKLLAEREGLQGGWGVVGGGFTPGVGKLNLGGISCPNAGGVVCPGK